MQLFSKQTQKPNVKHFYLVFYLIKDAGSNLQRFLKASDTPISISDLKNPLKRYFFTPELSSDQIEILSVHELSEKDYYEYKQQVFGRAAENYKSVR